MAGNWFSGNCTSISLRVLNVQIEYDRGNDFAPDDIYFGPCDVYTSLEGNDRVAINVTMMQNNIVIRYP